MNQSHPAISVIMPVYNAGRFLRTAMNSVLAQTFSHFELFLVDDGSTDGSAALCDGFSQRDNRIRVIHTENRGVSAARNTGLRHARGEYIAFLDHDDCYAPDFLERMLALAKQSGAQMVKCGRANIWMDEAENFRYAQINCTDRAQILSNSEFAHKYWIFRQNHEPLLTAVWNGLYLRRFIVQHQILFPEGLRHGFEDMNFNNQMLLAGTSVAFLPSVLYMHYIRDKQSISAAFYPDWLPARLAVFKLEQRFICREAPGELGILNYYEFERCMMILKRIKGRREQKKGLKSMVLQIPLKNFPLKYYLFRDLGEKRLARWCMLYLHFYRAYFWKCLR